MRIRLFEENDRGSVIELWRECGLTRPWNDPDSDISRKLAVQPELFFVGEFDEKVVSSVMAGYDGHRGSIFYLAVAPEYRRRGFGKLLIQTVENALKSMGCPKLNIVVRSSNETVLDFYSHLGYTIDDVVSIGKRLIPDD